MALGAFFLMLALAQPAYAQTADDQLNMNLVVSEDQLVLLFGVFIVSILGIVFFLARDVIMRRQTTYDSKEFESKKDRTYEKYHSDWGDDYEDVGAKGGFAHDRNFRKESENSELPDYYEILQVPRDATQHDIKKQYRILAKQMHPDKTRDETKDAMAQINEAYEVLSNPRQRAQYDQYVD